MANDLVIYHQHTWIEELIRKYLFGKGLESLPQDPRELSDLPVWLKEQGYASTTIAVILAPIREAYAQAGIATRRIIRPPARPRGFLKDAVSAEGVQSILDCMECETGRNRAIVGLFLYLGLRDVEASRLDAGDFYEDNGKQWLRVWRKYRSCKDEKFLVTNSLLDTMLAYQEATLKDRLPDAPMFIGKKGKRLRPDCISRLVSGIMKKAGVKTSSRITPHSLRHTAITKVLLETKNVRMAQKFAGHTDVRTTERYLHDILSDEERPESYVNYK